MKGLMGQDAPAPTFEEPTENAALKAEGPEADFINSMVAEAVDYVHGENRDKVVELLAKSDDTSGTIGAITYKLTRGLIEKHKKAGLALDIEMDTALGVATEIIDMLMEVQERVQEDHSYDPQKIREDALLHVMTQHSETLSDDDVSRQDAAVMLRGMMQGGEVDQAFDYVNKRAKAEGINPQDMMRQGTELAKQASAAAAPQKKPVAAGVQQGLMGGAP